MSNLRILIVDDEPPAREAIAVLLKAEANTEIVGQVGDGAAALEAIRTERPDLVFLDVQMPGLGGFEVLDALDPKDRPAIVFVTAYDQHAIRAFELSAIDYLVKPFGDDRFKAALERAKTWIRHAGIDEAQLRLRRLLDYTLDTGVSAARSASDRPSRIGFRVGGDYHLVGIREIVWIEAQGDFVKLAAEGQVHRVRETLQEVERRLDPARFVRVHRSFLVNVDRVRKVSSSGANGELVLLMSDGVKVPVSRSRRASLADLMK